MYSKLSCKIPHFSKKKLYCLQEFSCHLDFSTQGSRSWRGLTWINAVCKFTIMLFPCTSTTATSHFLQSFPYQQPKMTISREVALHLPSSQFHLGKCLGSINHTICHLKLQPTNSPVPAAPPWMFEGWIPPLFTLTALCPCFGKRQPSLLLLCQEPASSKCRAAPRSRVQQHFIIAPSQSSPHCLAAPNEPSMLRQHHRTTEVSSIFMSQ